MKKKQLIVNTSNGLTKRNEEKDSKACLFLRHIYANGLTTSNVK